MEHIHGCISIDILCTFVILIDKKNLKHNDALEVFAGIIVQ